jgi:aerobic carbon-monoxide dehydrogenase small subunit
VAAPPTAVTRCPCWPAGPSPGRGSPTGKRGGGCGCRARSTAPPAVADDVWEGESLLFLLRERLGLPGSKNAYEQDECGSCTVLLDGVAVCACLVAAGQAQGADIRTVEGLAPADALDPVQQAFVEAGAVQCGFCTPGLIVAMHYLLRRVKRPDDAEIRETLPGNLCRCTGGEKILDAVRQAASRLADAADAGGAQSKGRSRDLLDGSMPEKRKAGHGGLCMRLRMVGAC